jgi:hypothetical protein
LEKVPEECRAAASFKQHINLDYFYSDPEISVSYSIEYERDETDEELNARMEKNKKAAATARKNRKKMMNRMEKEELETYKRLKEKYGDAV